MYNVKVGNVSILKLIADRANYPVKPNDLSENLYISHRLNSSGEFLHLVVPNMFLSSRKYSQARKELLDRWQVCGIFDLSSIWAPFTSIKFTLLIFNRNVCPNIKFGKYFGIKTFKSNQPYFVNSGTLSTQTIEEPYKRYIHSLETYLYEDKLEPNNSDFSFWKILHNSFDLTKWEITYYEPEFADSENKLINEHTEPLISLCEVIKPRKIRNTKGKLMKTRNFKYPLIINELDDGETTSVSLLKGDILLSDSFSGAQKFHLIEDNFKTPVFASDFLTVIRTKTENITPEYLFLYLQSETIRKYFLRNLSGGVFQRINRDTLHNLPVIIPEQSLLNRSRTIFESLFLQKKEDLLKKINKELFTPNILEKPIQQEFLQEELDNLRIWKREIIEKLLQSDFAELEKCKQYKLYKSFLILSGSVLEAFLLDWLGEIENKDYFSADEEEYTLGKLIFEKMRKTHKDIFDPEIIKKASYIKDKRNLVHPKVYFNNSESIDDTLCSEIISDLRVIFSKRL